MTRLCRYLGWSKSAADEYGSDRAKENEMKRLLLMFAAAAISTAPAFSQAANQVSPNNAIVNSGVVMDGSIKSLFQSDNSYWVLGQASGFKQIQVELAGTAPALYGERMAFMLESSVVKTSLKTGTIVQVVELYNYRDQMYANYPVNPWVTVDVRKLTSVDQTAGIKVPTKMFVEAGTGNVRTRVTWYSTQPVMDQNYFVGADWACWMFE